MLTVNSLGVNTSEGKNSSDYISYVAQCFGGQRQNYVTKGVIYEIEKVPPFKGKWISQNDDFIALGKSLFKLYLSTQNRLQYELEKVVSNGTGFIPLQLQLTVDGISGVKIYNKLNVDQKFLPSNYPEALNFITMKANQRIEGNVWESEYECFSIPASTAVPSYKLLAYQSLRAYCFKYVVQNLPNPKGNFPCALISSGSVCIFEPSLRTPPVVLWIVTPNLFLRYLKYWYVSGCSHPVSLNTATTLLFPTVSIAFTKHTVESLPPLQGTIILFIFQPN